MTARSDSPLSSFVRSTLSELRSFRILRNIAALTFLAGVVAACGGTDKGPPAPCPQLIMPALTRYMTVFDGGTDLSNIAYEAKIDATPAVCYYSVDEERRYIRNLFKVQVQVTRGPKFKGDAVRVKYVIGVTGPGGVAIANAKQTFDVDVDFSKGETSNISVDEIDPVKIFPKENENGDYYRILVGLDLTAEQLDFNKRNPRK